MAIVKITLDQQIKEVQRELDMRRRKYPEWVRDGKMRAETAARQIAVMEAIELTLKGMSDTGKLAPSQLVVQTSLFK